MTKDYNFFLTPRDFNAKSSKYPDDAPYASSGQLYDLLAIASGHKEINDIEDGNLEYYDAVIEYALKSYDYESAFIKKLNEQSTPSFKFNDGHGTIYEGDNPKYKASGLLFGAWIALEYPEEFSSGLKDWKETVEEAAHDCLGGYEGREGLPIDLAKELDEDYNRAGDDMMREYLHGDHQHWAGVYVEAERALFRDFISITLEQNEDDRRANRLGVNIDEEEGRQMVADYEGVELTKARISEKRVKAAIVGTILHGAEKTTNERKARQAKYRAEREAQEARQKERKEREEAERKAKLMAMTK